MKKEKLSPITCSNTPKYGEVFLNIPGDEIKSPEKTNLFETLVLLDGHPINMSLKDLRSQNEIGAQPNLSYSMRLVQGDNAYAIALLRDGLSIVDMKAMDDAMADLKDRESSDDPIENLLREGGEERLAHELSTRRLEEGGVLNLGEEDNLIELSLNEGVIHIEVKSKKPTGAKLFYSQYLVNRDEYSPFLLTDAWKAEYEFEEFKAKAEKARKKMKHLGKQALGDSED